MESNKKTARAAPRCRESEQEAQEVDSDKASARSGGGPARESGGRVIVLASASPRRRELLAAWKVPFRVLPAEGVDEERVRGEPAAAARTLAGEKARSSQGLAIAAGEDPARLWVLAADTVVALEGDMLGKPDGAEDARRILRRLSGRTHQVITAVAVIAPGKTLRVEHETSEVEFRRLEEAEIEAYVQSGDPLDKAGAYGIQGGGAKLVAGFRGCFYNIVGLPVRRALALLEIDAPACDCGRQPLQRGEPGCAPGGMPGRDRGAGPA